MLHMTITDSGIEDTISNLEGIASHLSDHQEFMTRVVEPALRNEMRRVFRTQGYRSWARLDPQTIRQKGRQGYSIAPLVRTGRYRRSLENLRGIKHRRNVLELDTRIPYAAYLEYGTSRMPARPVFSLVAERIRRELPGLWNRWAQRRIVS